MCFILFYSNAPILYFCILIVESFREVRYAIRGSTFYRWLSTVMKDANIMQMQQPSVKLLFIFYILNSCRDAYEVVNDFAGSE